jgi:hypothetical protein
MQFAGLRHQPADIAQSTSTRRQRLVLILQVTMAGQGRNKTLFALRECS